MHLLHPYLPWLVLLILFSAFFSSSEAALFYLGRGERRRLASGSRAQRVAGRLLAEPERLLTAILFWNLSVNITYFTLVSIAGLRLERAGYATGAGTFGIAALLSMIVFSEMLPKSLAVLRPGRLVSLVAIPLAATVQLVDPLIPAFRVVNLLSRRLVWPSFQAEPYLHVGDLERAVELSTNDAELLEQEQSVLQSLVLLSDLRAEELMRPRMQFLSYRPPVSLTDLEGSVPPSGYLLVTEPGGEEVAGAIALRDLSNVPTEHLEHHAEPVAHVPWCTTVARTLDIMQRRDLRVAAVVNEFGETIGILTVDDILDTILSRSPSRSSRLLKRAPIRQVSPMIWHVTGMMSLRRLTRHFRIDRPASKSVTIAGVIQELIERLPEPGDQCDWGPFRFKVLEVPERGQLLVELTFRDPSRQEETKQAASRVRAASTDADMRDRGRHRP